MILKLNEFPRHCSLGQYFTTPYLTVGKQGRTSVRTVPVAIHRVQKAVANAIERKKTCRKRPSTDDKEAKSTSALFSNASLGSPELILAAVDKPQTR